MFGRKPRFTTPFDPETQTPVIKASICNGERVAGFQNKKDGHFTEVTLIKTEADLAAFRKAYGLGEIRTIY